jgi:hypothetical protein
MKQEQIKSWRKVFKIFVAAMEFADHIGKEFGGPGLDERGQEMLSFHKEALAEMEKENPSADVIHALITKMEINAASRQTNYLNF